MSKKRKHSNKVSNNNRQIPNSQIRPYNTPKFLQGNQPSKSVGAEYEAQKLLRLARRRMRQKGMSKAEIEEALKSLSTQ